MPDEPEVLGLTALLMLTEARRAARTDAEGTLIRLPDQDRTLWDRELIDEGSEIVRACLRRNRPGPYQIQAAIAAVHADAITAERTEWKQILCLYDQLLAVSPGPVVALNRSVAVAEVQGPEVALEALADLDLGTYNHFHATHAELLERAGRPVGALTAIERSIELVSNDRERIFLEQRRARIGQSLTRHRYPPCPSTDGR